LRPMRKVHGREVSSMDIRLVGPKVFQLHPTCSDKLDVC